MNRQRLVGAAWIAASASGFGAMAIFVKQAYAQGVGLESLLFLRFALAGACLSLFMVWRRLPWPERKLLPSLLLMGGVGYVGQAYCYFAALRHASAGLTALLLYLFPILVALFSALLGRQRLTQGRALAVAVAFSGTLLTIGGSLAGSPLGIALGLGAACIYAIYILAGERLTAQAGPLASSAVIMVGAALVYGGLALALESPMPTTPLAWGAVLGIVFLSTILGMVGFFAGMARLGAADAAALSTLEPLVTLVLAALFLGERLGLTQMLGGLLILGAVLALTRNPPQDH